ncbi:MAG: transglycosylase domain-containing protein [Erysipelotrichaceae bacterium]|nr:transglycosylase domain-containing protein [Erysipelotrichaceae bacterium]
MKLLLKAFFIVLIVGFSFLFLFYLIAFITPISNFGDNNRIRIFDQNQVLFYESNNSHASSWVSYEEIPQTIIDSFVSIEDKHYFYHFGFDPLRIIKAMIINMKEGDIHQGGSTITQQYAKNQYLTNEQTWQRKIKEAFLAAQLETHYTKEQILEGYLNTIYFGHGIYGISDASFFFFDKTLQELSLSEIAMLAGIPNGPAIYSPFINLENSIFRQQLILQTMLHNQYIDEATYQKVIQQPIQLKQYDEESLSQSELSGYYRDAVIAQAIDMGYLDPQKISYSIDIYTYYDPMAQRVLVNQIKKENTNPDMEVAGIILQPYTSHVKAISGGKEYSISQYNRALYSKRQVASTIKPLLYYLALQEGFTPSTTFLSQYTTFQISPIETYAPTNYNHVYPDAPISLINAISLSDNVYAMKTHLYLGVEALTNALSRFGIEEEPNASLALGTASFPLIKLASIYNTFASEGLYSPPAFIQQIQDDQQHVIYQHDNNVVALLQANETLILNQLLRSTFDIKNNHYTIATMLGYEPNVTTACKSGTSDWDSIVVGFNPHYTVAIWNGYDDNRIMDDVKDRRISKRIWKGIFNELYQESTENPWYQLTPDLEARKVNPINGELSTFGSWYWYLQEEIVEFAEMD